jgi:5,5'-dehydrodivanillate O-demethylase
MDASINPGRRQREPWEDVFHTGPGTIAGKYLRTFWHPVWVGDLLKPGRSKPLKIMSEDFTLYRGEGGKVHLLDFRCRHRGTQLSTGWVEGDEIRCFYHGWKYGPDGQCTEQPNEPKPFCERIKIKSYPIREYLGLIFAYLGEGEPPEFPLYPDWEKKVQASDYYMRECNYFQHMNNDLAHVPWVHGLRSGETVPLVTMEETEFGCQAVLPNGRVHIALFLMPNMAEITSVNVGRPPYDGRGGALFWRVPIDDASHYNFSCLSYPGSWTAGGAAEEANRCVREILAGNLHIEDLKDGDMNVLVNVADALAQCGQGAIYEDWDSENLSRHDGQVVMQRAMWLRELRAMTEGKPLKQWRRLKAPEAPPSQAALAAQEAGE